MPKFDAFSTSQKHIFNRVPTIGNHALEFVHRPRAGLAMSKVFDSESAMDVHRDVLHVASEGHRPPSSQLRSTSNPWRLPESGNGESLPKEFPVQTFKPTEVMQLLDVEDELSPRNIGTDPEARGTGPADKATGSDESPRRQAVKEEFGNSELVDLPNIQQQGSEEYPAESTGAGERDTISETVTGLLTAEEPSVLENGREGGGREEWKKAIRYSLVKKEVSRSVSLSVDAARRSAAAAKKSARGMQKVQYTVTGKEVRTFLLDPTSKFFRRWDTWTCLLLIYTSVVTPYEVAFLPDSSKTYDGLFFFNRLVDFSFLLDIFFNFFLPIQTPDGKLISKHESVVYQYLTTWFILDVVSVFPFDFVGMAFNSQSTSNLRAMRVVRLLKLAKLLRVLRAGRMFQRWESYVEVDYASLELAKFIIITIVVAHWLACTWYMVKELEEREVNWLSNYDFIEGDAGAMSKYLCSFYWSVATLSTLGYGDVVPTTDLERLFVIVATVMGASVYAYIIGTACSIVAGMGEKQSEFYKRMDQLNAMMREKELPRALRMKLRDYFRFAHSASTIISDDTMLAEMSPALRADVARLMHDTAIMKIPKFAEQPQSFHAQIALLLKISAFAATETVMAKNDWNNTLIVVQKGMVACKAKIHSREMEATIGTDIIDPPHRRTYTAYTISNCILTILNREGLMEVLERFPDVHRALRRNAVRMIVRDRILSYCKAIRSVNEKSTMSVNMETMFETDMRPLMYQHHLKVMEAGRPEEYKRLMDVCSGLQRKFRVKRDRQRRYDIETKMRAMGANVSGSDKQLVQVLIDLELYHYYGVMLTEKIDSETVMMTSVEGMRLVTGIPLGDCARLKKAVLHKYGFVASKQLGIIPCD
ncbi:hypothetical protein CYMTET_31028 [Cymbomonas tetramitiformis]|uniref:Cyclic nucleotide-binding domain-containing protein n=1 Tax=Cymbomonas tetramitiformis TaxID=36881 RepID=A0AAE0FHN2_9CHLO|nr:hypothetical protein CYMTET_31028 [Cymbomonas tetramitiformis]